MSETRPGGIGGDEEETGRWVERWRAGREEEGRRGAGAAHTPGVRRRRRRKGAPPSTCCVWEEQVGCSTLYIQSLSVVLNLIGGTEPCKLHQCIHRTLRNWKNKIWFLQNIFPLFLYTRESILYVFVQPLSFFARHSKYEGIERVKENHKWRTITTATSRLLSSLQHRHQSQAMWRDQLQPMMTSRLIRVGWIYFVLQKV